MIIEHDRFIVPTLRIMHKGLSPWGVQTSRDQLESLRKAYDAGARIAMGTDSTGSEHFENGAGNAVECALMSKVMAAKDVLVSTTRTAAEALGIADDVGTIEPGRSADLIAIRESPLERIEVLQDVAFVMHRGRVVRHES